jgi:hypothetical protein
MALINRDRRFRISVTHPDEGREFYTPDAEAKDNLLW